ncbi:hypothetical protein [Pseudomonas sp. Irchel s3f10]|uniref:hypothetical protein n=1 Tax=Pseudomonas sp. Irchel s3f10 TaxID=2009137 RepID=UPI000BA2C3D9|nr:hypothetical protein [Pseudomonas sp. Irchel s3f10]
MANLIKNGDFSQEGNEWTASNPDNVVYEEGYCLIGSQDSISQDVVIGNGGTFKLSARLKTDRGFGSRVSVQPHPTGEPTYLYASGGQPWTEASEVFSVQTGTLKLTITLLANDGPFDEKGSYFDDLELLRQP